MAYSKQSPRVVKANFTTQFSGTTGEATEISCNAIVELLVVNDEDPNDFLSKQIGVVFDLLDPELAATEVVASTDADSEAFLSKKMITPDRSDNRTTFLKLAALLRQVVIDRMT